MMLFADKCQRSLFILACLIFSSCTTQLGPRYDALLFERLTDVNVKVMSLFALVSNGTKSTSFNDRESTYNELIGSVEALVVQSKARPVPENSISEKVNAYLDSRDIGAISTGVAPSADALKLAANNLVKMKEVDREKGLKPGAVAVFKNAVATSMDQAITYESFLKR